MGFPEIPLLQHGFPRNEKVRACRRKFKIASVVGVKADSSGPGAIAKRGATGRGFAVGRMSEDVELALQVMDQGDGFLRARPAAVSRFRAWR
jgi:hypothetical protein